MRYTGERQASSLFNGAVDLIVLHAAAGETGRIVQVAWSGGATSTVAIRTRLCRASTAGSSPTTAVDVQKAWPGPTAALDCVTTVTSPTRQAGNLLPFETWNGHGGVIRYHAGPGELLLLLGDVTGFAQAMLRNEAGVADGSCGVSWEE
jgi:hypothetical protein